MLSLKGGKAWCIVRSNFQENQGLRKDAKILEEVASKGNGGTEKEIPILYCGLIREPGTGLLQCFPSKIKGYRIVSVQDMNNCAKSCETIVKMALDKTMISSYIRDNWQALSTHHLYVDVHYYANRDAYQMAWHRDTDATRSIGQTLFFVLIYLIPPGKKAYGPELVLSLQRDIDKMNLPEKYQQDCRKYFNSHRKSWLDAVQKQKMLYQYSGYVDFGTILGVTDSLYEHTTPIPGRRKGYRVPLSKIKEKLNLFIAERTPSFRLPESYKVRLSKIKEKLNQELHDKGLLRTPDKDMLYKLSELINRIPNKSYTLSELMEEITGLYYLHHYQQQWQRAQQLLDQKFRQQFEKQFQQKLKQYQQELQKGRQQVLQKLQAKFQETIELFRYVLNCAIFDPYMTSKLDHLENLGFKGVAIPPLKRKLSYEEESKPIAINKRDILGPEEARSFIRLWIRAVPKESPPLPRRVRKIIAVKKT